VTALMSKWNKY